MFARRQEWFLYLWLIHGHDIKPAQIPCEGYEYQDLVGARFLIDFFRQRDLYDWITIERLETDFDGLDDIVCKLKDEQIFDLHQVKFTVEPDRADLALTWAWLLKKRGKGPVASAKMDGNRQATSGRRTLGSAGLITNRQPDIEFEKGLVGTKVDIDKPEDPVPDRSGEPCRRY